ncbi:MAG: response regulator [Deltaproteobacteria bacterium]|nr:MAG: response regulator [Deltaproteobacteria bacterium]
MQNLSILIVDDDPVVRKVIEQKLNKKELYEVDTAEEGVIAVKMLLKKSYDVILTDLIMPGDLGGIEVLEVARKNNPHTEVIVITANSSVDTAIEAMKKGAADYLEKPINFDELFLKLEKIANLKNIIKNAQDLQHNMDIIESKASQTIQDMEIQLGDIQQLIDDIEFILLDDSLDGEDKVEKALEKLEHRVL